MPVPGEFGMVVAQEKLAAQIGADILRQGGNAVDAAVATGFAMAVTYPRAGNIGGGGFMVIHSADRKEDIAIDYRETAPAATTRDIFLGADGKPDIAKSRDSALGIGVPGTVAGLSLALEKYGSGKFYARRSAEAGESTWRPTAWSSPTTAPTRCRTGTSGWRNGRHRRKSFPAPTALRCARATRWSRADLAATLTAIAEQGPRGFYEGPVAEKLVKAIREAGGIMTLDDLKSYQPVIRAPVRGSYRGYDIVSMPQPSSGGVVLLETLNILEGFPMHDMAQGSAPSLHVMIEAMKRAYADRARYLGDPAFVNAPIATLIAKDYAAKQRASIDLNRATPWTDALSAVPPREGSNTTHFSVVDSRGNAVSNTYYAELQLWRRPGGRRHRRAAQQRARRFHRGARRVQRLRPGRLRGQPAGPGQTAVVVDGADHRAEGRQAGAGDGIAGRQPHHLHGAAGDRQRAGLPNGRRRRGRRTPAASSMAAGRSAGRARLCR